MLPAVQVPIEFSVRGLGGVAAELQRSVSGVRVDVPVATGGATRNLSQLSAGARAANAALNEIRQQALATSTTLRGTLTVATQGGSALSALGGHAANAARQLAGLAAGAGAVAGVVSAFRDGVREALAFQREVVRLSQVTGQATGEVRGIQDEVTRLATSMGVSSRELLQTASALKQTGLNAKDTKLALEAVAQASLAPSFGSQREIVEGLIAVQRQFNIESKSFRGVLGQMNAVSAEFAAESGDLVEGVRRAGGSFRQAGGDLGQFLALMTAVRSTTRESSSSIADGFRTIFSRLQKNTTVEALKDLNVNLRFTRQEAEALGKVDLENQFVGAYEAVRRLSEATAGLRTSDPRYARVVELVGGTEQISRTVSLIQQFELAQKALAVARAGDISLTIASEKAQDALLQKTASLKEEFLALSRSVVDSRGFRSLAEVASTTSRAFIQLAEAGRPLLPLLTALVSFRVGQAAGSALRGQIGYLVSPKRFSRGGVVPGDGSTDSVSSLLQPGEFVVRRDAARQIGYERLHAMNAGRFATGGVVKANRRFDLTDVQRELAEQHLHLVDPVVWKAAKRDSRVRAIRDDAHAAGLVALYRAAQDFDESRGVAFSSFAAKYIRTATKDIARQMFGDERYRGRSRGVSLDEALLADVTAGPGDVLDQVISREAIRGYDPTLLAPEQGAHGLPSNFLSTPEGRHYLLSEYVKRGRSTHDIATSLGRPPKAVSRALQRHGIDRRSQSEAQRLSLESGRRLHPTAGRERTEEERERIADSLREAYASGRREIKPPPGRRRREEYASGGWVGESNANIAQLEDYLGSINLPHLDLKKLLTGLFYTRPSALPPKVGGLFHRDSKIAAVSNAARSPIVAHELAHAASARVAELSGSRFGVATIDNDAFRRVGIESLTHLTKHVLDYKTLKSYADENRDRPQNLLDEGVAFGFEHFVASQRAKFGRGRLSEDYRWLYGQRKIKNLFGLVENELLPEFLAATGTGVPNATAPKKSELFAILRELQGQTTPVRRLSQGGLVPGVGDTDSVPMTLPEGAFVLRKRAVQAVGADRLAQMRFAKGGSVPSLVTPGEWVFSPDEAARIGRPTLERLNALNAGGYVQRLATGGQPRQVPIEHLLAATATNAGTPTARTNQVLKEIEAALLAQVRELNQTLSHEKARAKSAAILSGVMNRVTRALTLEEQAETQIAQAARARALAATSGPETKRLLLERAAGLEQESLVLSGESSRLRRGTSLTLRGREVLGLADFQGRIDAGDIKRGGFFQQARGAIGDFRRGGFGALGRGAKNFVTNAGVTGALLVTPYLAQAADSFAGTAEQAVVANRESRYRSGQGLGGGVQGAIVGAAVGTSAFGIGGGVIGAVGGGLVGLVTSLREAEREIRQVKIGNAIGEFSTALSALATGGPAASPFAVSSARSQLDTYLRESTTKNRAEASSFFGGFNSAVFVDLQKKSLRQDLGPQLQEFVQVLNKQAEDIGRNGIGRQLKDLERELSSGNAGLNREFASIIASVRGVPLAEVFKEVRQGIEGGQRTATREKQALTARAGDERSVNEFGRLLLSLQSTQDQALLLRLRGEAIGHAFDGNLQAGRITARTENLEQLGRQDRGALVLLDILASYGGETGRALRSTGSVASDVARVLPSVLANAAAVSPTEGDDLSVRISNGIRESLGYKNGAVPPELQRAINSVTRQLNDTQSGGKGLSAVYQELQVDATRFAEQLLQGYAGPVREYGGRAGRELEDHFNRRLTGLAQYQKQGSSIGELQDQRAALRVQRLRTETTFAAERAGRPGQALDLLSLRDLDSGYIARNERLTGLRGEAAVDPRAIGRALTGVNSRLGGAVERQQRLFETPGALKDGRFDAAANEVLRLKTSAANLQQALQHLTNASERSAAAQEKLGRIREEKDSRLGLAARYATASADERIQIQQGLLLANRAHNAGTLDGLLPHQQRQVVEFLQSAGATTLTGFQGAPRADDALRELLKSSFGGIGRLTPKQQAEEKALQERVVKDNRGAEDAVKTLEESQKGLQKDFFAALQQEATGFFARLEQLLTRDRVAGTQNDLARAANTKREQERLTGQRAVLKDFGITTDAQVKSLRDKPNLLTDFTTAQAAFTDFVKQRTEVGANVASQLGDRTVDVRGSRVNQLALAAFAPNKADAAGLLNALGNQVVGGEAVTPEESEKIVAQFRERVAQQVGGSAKLGFHRRLITGAATGNYSGLADFLNGVDQDLLRRSLGEATATVLTESRGEKIGDARTKARAALQDAVGITVPQDVRQDSLAKVKEALDAFGSQSLAGLDERVKSATAEFDRLTEAVKQLNDTLGKGGAGGPVVHRAAGGGVDGPRGTDTLRAYLTPGEFVVRRESAQANLSLLKRINDAKGPVFAAGGGLVDDLLLGLAGAGAGGAGGSPLARGAAGALGAGLRAGVPGGPGFFGLRQAPAAPAGPLDAAALAAAGLVGAGPAGMLGAAPFAPGAQPLGGLGAVINGLVGAGLAAVTPAKPQPPSAASGVVAAVKGLAGQVGGFAGAAGKAFGAVTEELKAQKDFSAYEAGLERELQYQAAANPFGASASYVAGRAAQQQLRYAQQAQRARDARQEARDKAIIADAAQKDGPGRRQALIGLNGAAVPFEAEARARELANERVAAAKRREAQRDLNFRRFGGGSDLEKLDEAARQSFAGQAVFNVNYAGNVTNLRRRIGLSRAAGVSPDFGPGLGLNRPGSEGQRGLAGANVQQAQGFNNLFNERDFNFQRYKKNFAQQQLIWSKILPAGAGRGPLGLAEGGVVPGYGGGDRHAALLEGGEFVLRKEAVARAGLTNVRMMNEGGLVGPPAQYLAGGGLARGIGNLVGLARGGSEQGSQGSDQAKTYADLSRSLSAFGTSISSFSDTATHLTQSLTVFGTNAQALSKALESMPRKLDFDGRWEGTLHVTGAEALKALAPDIKKMVEEGVVNRLRGVFKQLPDLRVELD